MLLILQEQTKKRNMLEGELEEFLLETQVSEFEIYQIYQEGMPTDVNFTVLKGEIKESNFSYHLHNKDSQEFKDLKQQFSAALLELNNNSTLDLSMVNLTRMNIHFDRTDDCKTTFVLTLPWIQPSAVGMARVYLDEAVVDHVSYYGHLGGVSVRKFVAKDLCKVRVPDTAFKGNIANVFTATSQTQLKLRVTK